MLPYLRQRFVQSAISLFGLIAIVFFLSSVKNSEAPERV